MHIAFNTEELSSLDRQVLIAIVETLNTGKAPTTTPTTSSPMPGETIVPAPVTKPKPVKTTPPQADVDSPPEPTSEVKVAEEPESQADEDEDLVGGAEPEPEGPTMADAVAAATKLVSGGNAKKVKEALGSVGAKRVSEVTPDQIAAFLDALK